MYVQLLKSLDQIDWSNHREVVIKTLYRGHPEEIMGHPHNVVVRDEPQKPFDLAPWNMVLVGDVSVQLIFRTSNGPGLLESAKRWLYSDKGRTPVATSDGYEAHFDYEEVCTQLNTEGEPVGRVLFTGKLSLFAKVQSGIITGIQLMNGTNWTSPNSTGLYNFDGHGKPLYRNLDGFEEVGARFAWLVSNKIMRRGNE